MYVCILRSLNQLIVRANWSHRPVLLLSLLCQLRRRAGPEWLLEQIACGQHQVLANLVALVAHCACMLFWLDALGGSVLL
jgi:hypothetical protein